MTRALIDRLCYQVITPRITTMGHCATGCTGSARGGGICSACTMGELTDAIGIAKADAIYFAACAIRDAKFRLDDAIEAATEGEA